MTRWGRGATLRNVVIIAGRPFYRFVSPSLSLEGSLLIGVGQNSIWDIPSRIGLDWRFQDNIVLGTSLSADGPALFVNNILMMRKMTFRGAAEGVAGLRLSHNTVLDRINIGEERTFYREWLVRDNIAAGISVGAYAMREGKISHCCFYGPSPQYFKAAKPGEGCITVGPKKRPIFLGEENFDFRLHPKSPCRGKASDGGDIGARITPHMLQMLRLGKAILDNGGKVTPQFFQDFFAKQSPIQKRRTRRKALRE